MNVVIALGLIAIGMCIDAMYQNKIRDAECDAYETGYQHGKNEESAKSRVQLYTLNDIDPGCYEQKPSMAAPVEMPPTFEERLRKHGRATAKIKRGDNA